MGSSTTLAVACAAAALLWLAVTAVVLVGRAGHDLRRSRARGPTAATRRADRRLERRARGHRTELGRWRRVGALVELARRGSARARPPLYRAALDDGDPEVREAAVRALGALADRSPWARELLVEALEEEPAPRSRVAAQLEGVQAAAPLLVPLLGDARAPVRYWAALLLAGHPGTATGPLERLVDDPDPAVRRAAIESLAERGDGHALPRIVARLADEVMFVRAHACRAAGALGGRAVAPSLLPLLGDGVWWVRAAAKDALRSMGPAVAPVVAQALEVDDRFARNGAAEVLQDLGIVDELLRTRPDAPLLRRIFAAGEEGLEGAARQRTGLGAEAGEADRLVPDDATRPGRAAA